MSKSNITNLNQMPKENTRNYAYVTVVTNMSYFAGLSVLAKSFKRTKAKYPLFVLVPQKADPELKQRIHTLKLSVIESDDILIDEDFQKANRVSSWNQTFFKLNIMNLVQFDKIVFVDADMLLLQNIDHLFEYPSISATTGGKAANPEYVEFNSGLLVIEPSEEIFRELLGCVVPAIKRKTALGLGYGDQDVFNEYYPNWNQEQAHHFDEIYNAEITYLDALMNANKFRRLSEIAVLHYIGRIKIWNYSLIDNIRIIHGCIHDGKFFEARARLLFLWRLYFMR
jgi:glycogenin glucosyltransferase